MQIVRQTGIRKYDEWFARFPIMPIPNQSPSFVRHHIDLSIVGYDIFNGCIVPRMY